jgi:3',5'-cyclic AMP phosphodiesterase CpdA
MSRILLHISDLHFGRVPAGMPDALAAAAHDIKPDVVVVSGDLTQRARVVEFEQARAFLDRLPFPTIVIPGNHDVPLYNPYGRFVERLARYRRLITDDLAPSFVDDEVAIVGVNTARSLTWKGGRINSRQIAAVRSRLCDLPAGVIRVVATHHPHGVARLALRAWSSCGADVLLCGHLHIAAAEIVGRTVVVNAGTAISTRGRGQANSFNVIGVTKRERVTVTQWAWENAAFRKLEDVAFDRVADEWRRDPGDRRDVFPAP